MTDTNPYQSPAAAAQVTGVLSGSIEDLRSIAKFQKGILVCILIYLCAIIGQFALPPGLRPLLGIAVLVVGLVGAAFVFLLAVKTYGTARGILFGLLSLVPLIGLFILLMVNGKATKVLKENGIAVGLLGANVASI